jgi:tRNA nucleotidyltransferase/poly(A) polymerase
MKLSELLSAIDEIARSKNLSQPYIVGGLPRDRLHKTIEELNDVDITTGDNNIHYLARHVGNSIKGPNVSFYVMNDNHSRMKIGNFKVDFSSNFNIPNIEQILSKAGLDDPTEMQKELYSRDFTCNTALMTMDLKKIIDPTGLAIKNISNKTIKTCLHPSLTLGYDPKRVVRAIYLAGKLNFTIDSLTSDWISENPEIIKKVKEDYIEKKFSKGMKYNADVVVDWVRKLGLMPYLTNIPSLFPYQNNEQ